MAKIIPVPDFLLHTARNSGKLQGSERPGVTLRQFRGAVEAFTHGRVTVEQKKQTLARHRKESSRK